MSQLTLTAALHNEFHSEDFIVTEANKVAHSTVLTPFSALAIIGARGSGKTHLSRIWLGLERAEQLSQSDLRSRTFFRSTAPAYLVEDLDQSITTHHDEVALLELINHAALQNHPLLLTSALSLHQLSINLPDLHSRLRSMSQIALEVPSAEDLQYALRKQFSDHGLLLDAKIIDYALTRLPRNYDAVRTFAMEMNQRSLATGRKPSLATTKEILSAASVSALAK